MASTVYAAFRGRQRCVGHGVAAAGLAVDDDDDGVACACVLYVVNNTRIVYPLLASSQYVLTSLALNRTFEGAMMILFVFK